MINPFVSRGPIQDAKMFYGRHHEIREIASFLQGNQSVSIVGPRKIGKTSLLFHLMRPSTWPEIGLTDDFLFAYLDCEVLGQGSHEEIFGQFASEMINSLEERNLPPEPALEKVVENPSRLGLETAIRKLNRNGLRVVILLDEFERLSSNPSLDVHFFNALRSAAGRYQLIFITASANPLIQLTYSEKSRDILSSPFFNIFAQQFLSLFTEQEARIFIRQPNQAAGRDLSLHMEDFLYTLGGGHPLCLQVACFFHFETPDNSQEIQQRTYRELEANFSYYWHNLNAREQDTLLHLPNMSQQTAADTTQVLVLRELIHKCLLVLENGNYQYTNQAWRDFVIAKKDTGSKPTQQPLGTPLVGLFSGTHIGQYEIQDFLARGGMAEVYKAVHTRLGRIVAIKVLAPHLARESDFRRRFEREARAIANLNHHNIVQVFDFGEFNDTYYFVMEYVDGKDLANYLQENPGAMPLDIAIPILEEIASALDYAHQQGMIHRDVKPSNVLLNSLTHASQRKFPYRTLLTDFGIAKLKTSSIPTTGTGMMGTLDYIAPEQIQASGKVDFSADIYAFGILAYRILTGTLPFQGQNPAAILAGHLYLSIPDPKEFGVELPEHMIDALEQAMDKEPTNRFATASALIHALTSS